MDRNIWIPSIIILSLIGGILKIAGGVLYGSRSLFVDALTSFANIAALLFTIYYYRLSIAPPDKDHPFGHYRLGSGGKIAVMIAYGFVAGIAVSELIAVTHYTVSIYSVYYAVLGFTAYLGVIYAANKIGGIFKTYGAFTVSELIESIVVIAAALGGAILSYLIDYAGAILLTSYIFYEIAESFRDTITLISDKAPPPRLMEEVERIAGEHGLIVKDARIRILEPGKYHGDLRVVVPAVKTIGEAAEIIRSLKKELYSRLRVDVTVEIEPG